MSENIVTTEAMLPPSYQPTMSRNFLVVCEDVSAFPTHYMKSCKFTESGSLDIEMYDDEDGRARTGLFAFLRYMKSNPQNKLSVLSIDPQGEIKKRHIFEGLGIDTWSESYDYAESDTLKIKIGFYFLNWSMIIGDGEEVKLFSCPRK